MARLPYLPNEDASPRVREVFEKLAGRGAKIANIYRVMAHSEAAFLPFLRLGNALLERAALDPKIRELAILRVAVLSGSQYEWQQHEGLAREVGVSPEQMAAISHWADSAAFDPRERAVLHYVDAVAGSVAVDDETFARVQRHFSPAELVELTLSIGFWGMVARFLVPLQVDLEEHVASSSAELFGKPRA
jgi:AhpD family alkylhydroperoxidase